MITVANKVPDITDQETVGLDKAALGYSTKEHARLGEHILN